MMDDKRREDYGNGKMELENYEGDGIERVAETFS